MRSRLAVCLAASVLTSLSAVALSAPDPVVDVSWHGHRHLHTATPIQHLVVIFQENVSFDHYFGTYPYAANPPGEPPFWPQSDTPKVNGLSKELLSNNPNAGNAANGTGAINPFRLSRAQAATADQDHDYMPEQQAFDNGAMDLFPKYTGSGETLPGGTPGENGSGQVMGYYDGNTVTALWHYAQHFAMSDNSYNTTFGPSTPGALNLVSGQTNGVSEQLAAAGDVVADGQGGYTLISDADPIDDVCSPSSGARVRMGGKNVGELLSARHISWGFFEGGFDLSVVNANGSTGCKRSTTSSVTQVKKADYIPHHQPFQYYAATANPTHARPTSVAMIGHDGDAANHQYDLSDFYAAVQAGNMPAVSFLKAPGYQDGHAGYSDPLDEQQFIVHVLNFLQQRPEWRDTAVVIAYDDSDGWYDHQAPPQVNASASSQDALHAAGVCKGRGTLPGVNTRQPVQGRCGYGPRLPLLVVSPWARRNFVDHSVTDQSSITRFIEDNWLHGERLGGGSFDAMAGKLDHMFDFDDPFGENRRLFLDESTGEPVK
jgi:phospholipase C